MICVGIQIQFNLFVATVDKEWYNVSALSDALPTQAGRSNVNEAKKLTQLRDIYRWNVVPNLIIKSLNHWSLRL